MWRIRSYKILTPPLLRRGKVLERLRNLVKLSSLDPFAERAGRREGELPALKGRADGVEHAELVEPMRAVEDAGAQVELVSLEAGPVQTVESDINPKDHHTADKAVADVAVVGFDDFRLASLLPTPVSVVSTEIERVGRKATTLLLGRIEGDDAPPRRLVLPVSLISRGSGELAPSA